MRTITLSLWDFSYIISQLHLHVKDDDFFTLRFVFILRITLNHENDHASKAPVPRELWQRRWKQGNRYGL